MDFKFIVERTHYFAPVINVVMTVTIKGSPKQEDLQEAIAKATQRHEIFQSRVYIDENGDSFYALCPDAKYRIETIEATGDMDWKLLIHEQERLPFHIEKGDMIRFFIIKQVEQIRLVIIAHHLVGDGMAMIYLIRDIMAALDNPSIHYDKMPVRVFHEEDFPKDVKLNPIIQLLAKQINKNWSKRKKVFTYDEFLAMFHSYWKGRQNNILDATISGQELQKLLRKCKEQNVTVNSAIATAFLLAVKEEKEVGLAVNIRPEGYEGMGNFASGISIRYQEDNKKSFWDNAKKVHELIHHKLNRNSNRYFLLKFLSILKPTLVDATHFSACGGFEDKIAGRASDMFGYRGNPKGISISNLAKPDIPSTYGPYAIDSIEFVPPLIENTKRVIGIVTIEDRMTVTMQYENKTGAEKMEESFREAIHILNSMI
jgi:NRPS condensation-like uncharacterized protein